MDCITGSNQADCICSLEYESHLDGTNLVDYIGSVQDEFACKKLCASDDQCSVYTYYGPQDKVNPNVCFLLNSAGLQNPVNVCDNCTSGPAQCNTDQECQVTVFAYKDSDDNYNIMTDLVLFVPGEDSFDLSFEAKEKGCYINTTFLAIGGGGESNGGGGGGSGYIEIGRQLIFSNSSVLVRVGGGDGLSLVQVDGDGYSGGGGGSNYDVGGTGGTNGGDGVNGTRYSGGQGSGLDLSTLHLENFVLTPGKGGEPDGE